MQQRHQQFKKEHRLLQQQLEEQPQQLLQQFEQQQPLLLQSVRRNIENLKASKTKFGRIYRIFETEWSS